MEKVHRSSGTEEQDSWGKKKDGLFKKKCPFSETTDVVLLTEDLHVMSGLSWNLVSLETSLMFDYQRGTAEQVSHVTVFS